LVMEMYERKIFFNFKEFIMRFGSHNNSAKAFQVFY